MTLLYETPRCEDDTIVLTGYGLTDVSAHILGEDEETARRFGWWPRRSTDEGVIAAFEAWARDWREDGPTRTFAVRELASGRLVGGCQLRRHEGGEWTVSYWTSASDRRQGIATRALRLLLSFSRDEGYRPVYCDIATDNVSSRRVAEACGFHDPVPWGHEGAYEMVRYRLTAEESR